MSTKLIPTGLYFTGNHWYAERLGSGHPNPFTSSMEKVLAYEADKARLLHEHAGDVGLGSADPKPRRFAPQHDARLICATAFGAPYPQWDETSASFWLPEKGGIFGELETVKEIEEIPIPRWEENVLVQESIAKWEEFRSAVGEEQAAATPLRWREHEWTHPITRKRYQFSGLPSFLDLGSFLMGSEDYMVLLATDPPLANAFLRKCFEIAFSLSEFLRRACGRPLKGWCSMGGDNSCLVSPEIYRTYAMKYDTLAREAYGSLPRNLHSCGASKHLYEVWSEYPEREQIVLMQTRAMPGAMKPLRDSLPHTFVQLTVHQPQVDFEREAPERVKELVWQCAEDMGFRETSILVIFSEIDESVKVNVRAFREAGKEVNEEAGQRATGTATCVAGAH